jgi:hypothetical protein
MYEDASLCSPAGPLNSVRVRFLRVVDDEQLDGNLLWHRLRECLSREYTVDVDAKGEPEVSEKPRNHADRVWQVTA